MKKNLNSKIIIESLNSLALLHIDLLTVGYGRFCKQDIVPVS